MPVSDSILVFQWWLALFVVGAAAFPITKALFVSRAKDSQPGTVSGWFDQGYLFSKAVGMALLSYGMFVFGTFRILPFVQSTLIGLLIALFVSGALVHRVCIPTGTPPKPRRVIRTILLFFLEECAFLGLLFVWSWVKAHEPSIRGLEKFMDYGFMQSILNSRYFPAADMWWAGGFINYYFFGHLVTAVLTMLSGLELGVAFNLMLATLFALTASMSFSIGAQLSGIAVGTGTVRTVVRQITAGLLTAFLLTLGGNMQTIYAFTKGYTGENVVPFWTLLWPWQEFSKRLGEGLAIYWYANATRFIPFTIHEFPSYSFVVSDVHGHVLAIPFALLTIALLIMIWTKNGKRLGMAKFAVPVVHCIFLGFLIGVLLMTNALGGPVYAMVFGFLVLSNLGFVLRRIHIPGIRRPVAVPAVGQNAWFDRIKRVMVPIDIVGVAAFLTALPFLQYFSSFATGIGVNCPPAFLANSTLGPFLFEGVEKCQRSPLWMMALLWGFFWFTGIWLFFRKIWNSDYPNSPLHRILKVFYISGLVLITIPEFFYVKDIYPGHFRSNTMFKLGYEAFMLWSIVAAFVIIHFLFHRPGKGKRARSFRIVRGIFLLLLLPQLFLVSIYPLFSIRSYFGDLKTYRSLSGLSWMEKEYPDYFRAIQWLRSRVSLLRNSPAWDRSMHAVGALPVIVEADGDSYTDYNQVSAFSGVPTVTGWAVHEWLWRGSYNVVGPRKDDVRLIYESTDPQVTRELLDTYAVEYVLIGPLERQKYANLQETTIASLGTLVFQSGDTGIYQVGPGRMKEVGY